MNIFTENARIAFSHHSEIPLMCQSSLMLSKKWIVGFFFSSFEALNESLAVPCSSLKQVYNIW